jgi:hypothetical protein
MPALAKLKDAIPFAPQVRWLKRAIVGYGGDPQNDEGLLDDATNIAVMLKAAGARLEGSTMVEIGTGWMPILPLVFRMAGAGEVISMDLNRLMDVHTFRAGVSYVRSNLERILAREGRDPAIFAAGELIHPGRLESLADMCRRSGVAYRAPADFLDLQPHSCDYIVSRTVLEHVPERIVPQIFEHAKKVLKPGGMMCHWIDMSDHFEFTDKSLSRLDFLRYSDREWAARSGRPGRYQTRLRRYEYVQMLEQTGWEILSVSGTPHPKALEDLKTLPIAAPYTDIPHEELAILVSTIIAKPK